jgi:hypothetical protein
MSDESDKDPLPVGQKPAPLIDPLELKKSLSGIAGLALICGFLWILSSLGPKGAKWISTQTTEILGVKEPPATPPDTAPSTQQPTQNQPSKENQEPAASSKIETARAQLLEALGGPEKVVVKHIAISQDEKALVAGVIYRDTPPPAKLVEIYFDQDEFNRYVSRPDSPVAQEIKIWIQQ